MNPIQEKYPKLFEIFYPGFEKRNLSHPLLSNLQNPLFNRIITFLDQVVIVINHSTLTYEYASLNAERVLGYPAKKFMGTSIELMGKVILPEDMEECNP